MLYRLVRALVAIFLRIFNRWEIEGQENLPATGPVVLVANHVSQWDPLFLACSVRRTIHFMAKEELFKVPLLGQFLSLVESFPVKRGRVDRHALKMAAHYLEKGEVLGIFPEGRRSKTDKMLPFQPGAALFALRSAAPIVPVGLTGTKTSFPLTLRGRIRVKIGKPLSYPELKGAKLNEETLEQVSSEVQECILAMLNRQEMGS